MIEMYRTDKVSSVLCFGLNVTLGLGPCVPTFGFSKGQGRRIAAFCCVRSALLIG